MVRDIIDDDFLDSLEAAGAFKGREVEFLLGTLGGVGSEKFELHGLRSPVGLGLLGRLGLLAGADDDIIAVGAGNGAFDEDEVLVGDDLHDLRCAGGL